MHTIRSATWKKTQDKHKNQDNVVVLQEYSATTYSQSIKNSKLRETGGSKQKFHPSPQIQWGP